MLLISDLHMHLQALFFFIWFTFTNCRVIYLLLNSCSIYFYAWSFCSVFDLIWLVLLFNLAAKSFTNNMGLVEALYLVTNLRVSRFILYLLADLFPTNIRWNKLINQVFFGLLLKNKLIN
jgi:hypothetical protein